MLNPNPKSARFLFAAAFIALLAAGCSGGDEITGPDENKPEPPDKTRALMALRCTADVSAESVWCTVDPQFSGLSVELPGFGASREWSPAGPIGVPREAILIGQQHVNLSVLTSNVRTATDSFYFDTRLANKSPEPIGTVDGETSDGSIRIFFNSGPTTTGGTGSMTVANPTGVDAFTAPNQPYFGYSEILFQDDTTIAKEWRLHRDAGVTSFVFTLLVSANVEHPDGFVKVIPSVDTIVVAETTQLVDSVKNALGWPVEGQTVTWTTSDSAVATVNASGLVTGTGAGNVTITATNGLRTGSAQIAVMSNTNAAPSAVADTSTSTSAPGDVYHVAFNTQFNLNAPGILGNDDLGNPAATVTSFGGDSLTGSVTDHAAGATMSPLPGHTSGSLSVASNGSVAFTPPTGFTGYYGFFYRITNSSGTSDAWVRIAVGVRPNSNNSTYPHAIPGNVPVFTNTSTQTKVNATGDALLYHYVHGINGGGAVHTDGTYGFLGSIGFTGTGRIVYHVSNGFGASTNDTITFNVTGPRIWHVHPSAGGSGQWGQPIGCIVGPSSCLSNLTLAAGDVIYIAPGTFTNTAALTLLANMRIIGAGASGAFADAANANLTWPADAGDQPVTGAARPIINSGGANVFVLAAGNTIRGMVSGTTTGGASVSGSAVGTFAMGNAAIINGTGRGIDLTTSGTLAVALDSIIATGGTGNGINLQNQAGTFTSGITRVTNPSTTGINVTNSAGFSFGTTVVKKTSAGIGVNLATNTGTTSFASLVDSTSNGAGLVTSGAGTVTISDGHIAAVGGSAINVTNTTFNATLDSVRTSGSPTQGVLFSGSAVNAALGTGSIAAGTEGISATNASGTISFTGPVTGSQRPVSIANASTGSCPSVTLSGTVTSTANGILVQNCSSGTILFSGPVTLSTAANKAVQLASNTGATINFTGGALSVTTTSGNGFEATGGGTVNVTGANNTVSSTGGGTAVNVSSTTIGGDGLTFYRVNATGNGTNGIVLSSTGSGAFQVTGDGASDPANTTRGRTTAKAGGGTVALGSGGTISGRSGDGVNLSTTGAVTLRNMVISGGAADGIDASSVSGLILDNMQVTGHTENRGVSAASSSGLKIFHSEITGNATTAASGAASRYNLQLLDVTGTDSIMSSALHTSFGFVMRVANNSGTLNLRVENTQITGATNGIAAGVYADGTSNVTANFQNDSIGHTSARGIQAATGTSSSGAMNLTVNNTALRNNFLSVDAAHGSSGTYSFSITNNRLQTNVVSSAMAINVNRLGSPSFNSFGLFSGTISGNVIGTAGTANSGSDAGSGIEVESNGSGGITRVAIVNNTIREVGTHGIYVAAVDGNIGGTAPPLLEARIASNSISNMDPFGLDGIHVLPGALNTDDVTVCVDIANNSSTGIRNGLRVRPSGLPAAPATIQLEGWDGVTARSTYFTSRPNTLAGGSAAYAEGLPSAPGAFTAVANCNTP